MFKSNKQKDGSYTWASRLIIVVALSTVFILVGVKVIISYLQIGRTDYVLMDEYISSDVYFEDGTIRHSAYNYFPAAMKGDTIVVRVPLPVSLKKDDQAICFEFYNSIVTVSYKEKILYTYGEERAAAMRHIGHLVISVPVPEEAWGDQLTITLAPQEYEPYTNIKKVYLLPSVESRWYPLINNEFDGIIFLPLMVISFMAIIVFGVSFLMGYRQSLQGLFLAVFMFGVSCWYLGYQGLLHLVSSNIPICANAEYQALYMFMIPLMAYIRREKDNFVSRKILPVIEALFIVCFIVINALYLLNTGIDQSDFINYFRALLGISLIISVVSLLIGSKNAKDSSDKALGYGFVVVMIFGVIETIRVTAVSLFDTNENSYIQYFINLNFSRIMILIFLLSLVLSFILRLLDNIRKETQRQQLARLAYFDLLTGIPNRQDTDRNFNAMSNEELQSCAVLFFDANDLKKANDHYGHATGDELLKVIGEALKQAMEDHEGFYGRFGGDEFIACLRNKEDIEAVHRKFFSFIDKINAEKTLPFDMTVAYGYATLDGDEETEGTSPLIAKLIRDADENMYRNKQEMKKNKD